MAILAAITCERNIKFSSAELLQSRENTVLSLQQLTGWISGSSPTKTNKKAFDWPLIHFEWQPLGGSGGFLCHICWLCLMTGWHTSSCHKKRCWANINVARGNAVGTAETNSGDWHIGINGSYSRIPSCKKPGTSLHGVCNCVECGQECFQVRSQSLWCVSSRLWRPAQGLTSCCNVTLCKMF